MKKQDIIKFLKDNKEWVLQHCDGIGVNRGWWWLRNSAEPSKTIDLDGRAARAASGSLKRLPRVKYGSTDFDVPNSK